MEWLKIDEICNIIGGKPNPKDINAFDDGGIPFVKMKDLGSYHLTTNLTYTDSFLSRAFTEQKKYQIIKKGAILLPRSGSVSLNHRAILGIDACIVSHIFALEVINDKVDNFYLYYYLTLLDFGRIARKTTGLDSITFKRVGQIKIPVPSKPEQSIIVAQLSKIQELIDKRIKTIDLLDDYLRAFFLEVFGDPILDTKKIGKKPLSFFGVWRSGGTPPKKEAIYYNGEIPWFSSGELNDVFISKSKEYITSEAIKKTSAKLVKAGSLLVGMYDTAALKESIALVDSSCNQAIAFSKLDEKKCYSIFIYYSILLSKKYYLNQRKGARQKNLNLTKIKQIEVLNANINLQKKFVSIFEKIELQKQKYKQSLKLLENLFKATLHNAFSVEEKIDEENLFEDIIQDFKVEDFKKGERIQYLINWLKKDKKKELFSDIEKYNLALENLFALLEDESIDQYFDGNEIKLKKAL